MGKKILIILAFELVFQHVRCQALKLGIEFGGSTSNQEYVYNSIFGPYTEMGQYLLGANISYPLLGDGFGLFIETSHRVFNGSEISFNGSNLILGPCWRKSINSLELEIIGGYGKGWDKYILNDSQIGFRSISNNMSIFYGGLTMFIPTTQYLDLMIGARLTMNSNSNITASFYIDPNDVQIPSLLYSGMIGLSFNLFGNDK